MTPETQPLSTTKPKPFVFVLMPFRTELGDLYELGIRGACEEVGSYCERVDEQLFDGNILQRVYNQIAKADIIVSVLTGGNANVYYETGYAHALNKRVILLVNSASEIPFDLNQFPHIVYEGSIRKLKADLTVRLQWYVDNPSLAPPTAGAGIEYFINGEVLEEHPHLEMFLRGMDFRQYGWEDLNLGHVLQNGQAFSFTLSIHNAAKKTITSDEFSIAVIVPFGFAAFLAGGSPSGNQLSGDEKWIFTLDAPIKGGKLFIDGWHSIPVVVASGYGAGEHEFVLRCYTEFGSRDYEFTVQLRP